MKRILIVDDHDVVRAGLQRIISDIKMPGLSGLDVLS